MAENPFGFSSVVRSSPYEEGRASFQAGRGGEACPYPSKTGFNESRLNWWKGWLDARTEQKWGNK